MNHLYVLINIFAFIALVVFVNRLAIKSNGCSAFNPEVAYTRSMRGE